MGKAADLSDFVRGQIVMGRRFRTSISETARIVGCSRSTVVSTYAKWMNDGETSSRRHGVGRPHAIREKKSSETVSHGEAKPEPDSVSVDIPIQCRTNRIRIRHLPGEQLLPQCTVGHTQAGGGSTMLWGTFSWAFLGPVVVVDQTMNATGYLNIVADQLHPYIASAFLAGNGMFQQDNAPCHKAKIVLEWFQEHDAEFELMSWPPKSLDLNQIEHIWDVMGRQLRVQRPPIHNISNLRNRCLNIWYNLSLAICQGLVASMPRRVGAVLRAKGWPTRY
ncbi:transposable element Tcb1 transposase [Trichonephila clavipes]|nr:transposable element Tcb1 transposase [Trichonephila clavipes]